MKYSNSIEYNISTKADLSGLQQLQNALSSFEMKLTQSENKHLLPPSMVEEAKTQIQSLQSALSSSFNTTLGTFDLSKLRSELVASEFNVDSFRQGIKMAGLEGQQSMVGLISELGKLDTGIKQTNAGIEKFFQTVGNTVRWGAISAGWSQALNAFHNSTQYIKDLDESLTQIMLVTDYSKESMQEYAVAANEAAKAIGSTTTGMTDATLVFAQQGFDINRSQQLAELSTKLATASQQDTSATSDQITAFMNAYGLSDNMEALGQALDDWALIANISAADVKDLATASQKAASTANTLGVSYEQLAAQIATIESVTKQGGEQIGTALRTLYTRMSDIKLGETLEDGVDLGKVTQALEKVGVEVLDSFGQMRNVGDIIEDMMSVWDTLTQTQQSALAVNIAGRNQVDRFMALMNNSDMYKEYLGSTGAEASGTLDTMTEEAMDSLAGKTNRLQAAAEGLALAFGGLDEGMGALLDTGTGFLELLTNLVDAVGGGSTALLGIIAVLGNLASMNISRNIARTLQNADLQATRQSNANSVTTTLNGLGIDYDEDRNTKEVNDLYKYVERGQQLATSNGGMSEAELDRYNSLLESQAEIAKASLAAQDELRAKILEVGAAAGTVAGDFDAIFRDEDTGNNDNLNTSGLIDLIDYIQNNKENFKIDPDDFLDGRNAVQAFAQELTGLSTAFSTFQKAVDDADEAFDGIDVSIENVREALKTLSDTGAISTDTFEKLDQQLADADELVKAEEYQEAAKELSSMAEQASELYEILTKLANIQGFDASKFIEMFSDDEVRKKVLAARKAQNVSGIANKAGEDLLDQVALEQEINKVTQLFNGITQIGYSIQTIHNLGSILSNDNLSAGEKFLQIVMNLGTALPALYDGFDKIKSNIDSLGTVGAKVVEVLEKKKQAIVSNTAATEAETVAETTNAAAEAAKVTTTEAATVAEGQLTAANTAEAASAGASTVATMGQTVQLGALTAASKMATVAVSGLTSVLKFMTGPIGIAIGAVALLGSVISGQISAQTEKAKETAVSNLSEMKSAYDEVSNLQSQISSFEELYQKWQEGDGNAQELKSTCFELADALGDAEAKAYASAGAFDKFAESVRNAQEAASTDLINAAEGVLSTYDKELHSVFKEGMDDSFGDVRTSAITSLTNAFGNADLISKAIPAGAQKDAESMIYAMERLRDAAKEELDSLDKGTEGYTQRSQALKDVIRDSQAFLQENIDVQNAMDQMYEAEKNRPSFIDSMQSATNIDQIRNRIANNDVLGNTFQMQNETEQLETLRDLLMEIDGMEDVSKLITLELQIQGNENFSDYDKNFIEDVLVGLGEDYNLTEGDLVEIGMALKLDEEKSMASVYPVVERIKQMLEEGLDVSDIVDKINQEISNIDPAEAAKQTFANMKPVDTDVDADEFKQLGEYIRNAAKESDDFADSLETDADELAEVTEEMLRYSSALKSAQKNLDTWEKELKSDAVEDHAKAAAELQNIYADLIDLGEGVSLSNDFLTDIDNLNLLKEAMNGSEEAYRSLQDAAMMDILIHAGLDDTDARAKLDNLWAQMDALNWNDIEIGATIDDSAFIAALEEMINAAGMTAAEAEAALSGMGIDAEVTEETEQVEDQGEAMGVTANVTNVPFTGQFPISKMEAGNVSVSTQSFTGSIPQVTYTPAPVSTTTSRSLTAFGLKTTGATTGKSSGGNLKISGGSVKKGASGGQKYRNSSYGGGSNGGGSGSGGSGSCFVAGTLVSIYPHRFRRIENIRIGDTVLSYNEKTQMNEFSKVLQTMIHDVTEEIYTIYVGVEKLRVTGIHRFYTKRNDKIDWISAKDLQIGDSLLLARGIWIKISKILVEVESRLVYNFEVSHNHNYYVGATQILAHNKGSGGSGGSGSAYEPKTKDPLEDEIDLYEKINTQLDDVQTNLTSIEKETDRLVGDKARANLAKQLGLLERENYLLEEKLKIQKQEQADLAEDLSTNYGITFDSEGFIANYAAVFNGFLDEINGLIDTYNNTADEEGQEAVNEQIEAAQKRFEKFQKLYQRYDELRGKEIQDTLNGIEDIKDQIEDLRISVYNASQTAIDNLKDLRDAWAELAGLFTEYKSDSPFRATIEDAEKLKVLFGGTEESARSYYNTLINERKKALSEATTDNERKAIQSTIDYYNEQLNRVGTSSLGTGILDLASQDLARLQNWIDNPTAADNPFGENQEALYEAYQDAFDRMKELALESEEAWEDLEKAIINGYDDIAEREEDAIKRYDRIIDKLETTADLVKLAYGEDSYEKLAQLAYQQGQTYLTQANSQKAIFEDWKKRYDEIADKTSDIAVEVRKHMEDAEDELIELQESAAKAFQEHFENAIEKINADMNERIFGTTHVSDIEDDWERDMNFAKTYYDDVQKANAIEQLRLKYMNLLDDAQGSSLATQQQIRDAMNEQIAYLQDQTYLSQFNVDLANARLEILQKQIALEDARNNKNQMRLRRDTQGNYRYVYSSDQGDIRDKEADLLQSEMDAYNLSNDARMETNSKALAAMLDFEEKRKALMERISQGDKDAEAALEELTADFVRDMDAYSEELGDSWQGMILSLQWMCNTGNENIVETATNALEAIEEQTDESLNAIGIQWNSVLNGVISDNEAVEAAVLDSNLEMINAATNFRDVITNDVAPLVENGFDNISGAIDNAAVSTRDLADATDDLRKAMLGDNQALVEATAQLEDYRKQLDDVKNSSAETARQLRLAQENLDRSEAENLNYKTQVEDLTSVLKNGGTWADYTGEGKTGIGDYSMDELAEGIAGNIWMYGGWGNDPTRHALMNEKFGDMGDAVFQAVQWYFDVATPKYGYEQAFPHEMTYYQKFGPSSFDTGGYTGEWDDGEGRVAFLHQKELVLNESDTKNILAAVEVVRQMTDLIKTAIPTSMDLAQGRITNISNSDTIEQRVEITAEFPSVQDSAEISAALLNLADSAYQYSYRER